MTILHGAIIPLLLLYRNGFDAGKYISFEGVVNDHKAEYYEALRLRRLPPFIAKELP